MVWMVALSISRSQPKLPVVLFSKVRMVPDARETEPVVPVVELRV